MTPEPLTRQDPVLLTRAEAGNYLRVHPRTVDRLRSRGQLKAVLIGRRRLYRREDLDRYVEAQREA